MFMWLFGWPVLLLTSSSLPELSTMPPPVLLHDVTFSTFFSERSASALDNTRRFPELFSPRQPHVEIGLTAGNFQQHPGQNSIKGAE
jgi:hypothetical protein